MGFRPDCHRYNSNVWLNPNKSFYLRNSYFHTSKAELVLFRSSCWPIKKQQLLQTTFFLLSAFLLSLVLSLESFALIDLEPVSMLSRSSPVLQNHRSRRQFYQDFSHPTFYFYQLLLFIGRIIGVGGCSCFCLL